MADKTKDLYTRLVDAGCEIDNWASDLYVLKTPESTAIIKAFEMEGGISNKSEFTSRKDGRVWIELPFAYSPFWYPRAGRQEPRETTDPRP